VPAKQVSVLLQTPKVTGQLPDTENFGSLTQGCHLGSGTVYVDFAMVFFFTKKNTSCLQAPG
jgi:hypothetical protein